MDYGKYIIGKVGAIERIVMFDAGQDHGVMATALFGGHDYIVAAGQIRILMHAGQGKIKVQCFGESVSIGISSRPDEDAELAAEMLGIDPDDLATNEESRG